MADAVITHTLLLWAILTLILLGIVAGVALASRRLDIIRGLRDRVRDADARAQSYLDRIEELTKDTPDASGHPYRKPAAKQEEGMKIEEPPKPEDPNKDAFGRSRWRGKEEFVCEVCGNFECKDIAFALDSSCAFKHKGPHLHVACTRCNAVHSFGEMHKTTVYRSELPKGKREKES